MCSRMDVVVEGLDLSFFSTEARGRTGARSPVRKEGESESPGAFSEIGNLPIVKSKG